MLQLVCVYGPPRVLAVPDESMAEPEGESATGAQLCKLAGARGCLLHLLAVQCLLYCLIAVLRVAATQHFAATNCRSLSLCILPPSHHRRHTAADVNARSVVLSHHGAGMIRELLWGHVTMHVTKFCTRALVVLEPRHVGK